MKKLTRSELKNRLDKLVQTYARYKRAFYIGDQLVATCVTCGKVYPVEGKNCIQGGHCWTRACIPLRWKEESVNAQCSFCNCFLHGNEREYALWFIKVHGQELFDEYNQIYKEWRNGKVKPFTIQQLRQLYNSWLTTGRALEKQFDKKIFPSTWKEEL